MGNLLYEKSYEELNRIKKQLTQERVTIDFSKLDNISSGRLRQTLIETTSDRINDVIALIQSSMTNTL